MAFDGIFLHQIVKQLQDLVSCRIVRIYQISDTEVLFVIKGHVNTQLMISAHCSYNRIHLTNRTYPTRSTPSNFIIVLRKYLEGGFINSIEQVDLDRYLIINITSRNDIGDKINVQLYVELMGKYANLILVQNNKIIDALKHIPPFENTIRTIQPGAIFKPTAPQENKINPFTIKEVKNDENLFERLTGFSPLLSEEVRYRLVKQTYQDIIDEIQNSKSMYLTTLKDQEYFHCIPLTHLSSDYQQFEISEGLDYLYFSKEEKERIRQITGDLFKFTRKEISKINGRIDRLNGQLEDCYDADKYRYYGENIFANLDKITKGDKQVTLIDFENKEVTIPLDNKLDGKGNGKKYFTKYHKLTTGIKYIKEQLEIANDNLEYFTTISNQLENADFLTASEIKSELINNGYIKAKSIKNKPKRMAEPNFNTFVLNNHHIYVGKNNIQNEYITFKKANRFDYWFHVKDGSGSHVVIDCDKPNEQEIRACAMLAAYYSKQKESSSIPVNYTLIKELKKIPNSKIGKVIMKTYKTIYIDIDKHVINQLINQ